jgi:hypothetical protein
MERSWSLLLLNVPQVSRVFPFKMLLIVIEKIILGWGLFQISKEQLLLCSAYTSPCQEVVSRDGSNVCLLWSLAVWSSTSSLKPDKSEQNSSIYQIKNPWNLMLVSSRNSGHRGSLKHLLWQLTVDKLLWKNETVFVVHCSVIVSDKNNSTSAEPVEFLFWSVFLTHASLLFPLFSDAWFSRSFVPLQKPSSSLSSWQDLDLYLIWWETMQLIV